MKKNALKIGTLIRDHDKIGVVTKVIEVGQLNAKVPIISWRANYEITYTDGTTLLVSCKALDAMIHNGVVEIYYPPAGFSLPLLNTSSYEMELQTISIDKNISKSQAVLYYLFIDEQLLCAWWDYLDAWEKIKDDELSESTEFRKKVMETMKVVEYWENILDQLKQIITYEDIEDYIREHPEIKKSYLFMR